MALLATILTAAPSLGLPLRPEVFEHRQTGLGDWAVRVLHQLWALISKEGPAMDPHGASAPGQLKEGLIMDPSGACATSPGCGQQPAGQEGTAADPSGGE
jgi:hypothetical protein